MKSDRGSIDSIESLVGGIFIIALMLFVIEVTAYWHGRNIYDSAAAEGARLAAAFDGSCADGESRVTELVAARNDRWADSMSVSCDRTSTNVTMTVSGHTMGLLFGSAGYNVNVVETAPVER